MRLFSDHLPSAVGAIHIVSDGEKLFALDFEGCEARMEELLKRYYGKVELTPRRDAGGFTTAIQRYLDGDLDAIDELAVATPGTPFQQQVWRALRHIPHGTTTSYGALAGTIGKPKASRAVGMANGSNPIALVVPCHRVIGANGDLTGYGGGMQRKQWLLQHERALLL